MTQLKPFNETMTEIANVFGFKDIQLDDLEKYYKLELQDPYAFDKKRTNIVLFLNNYSNETLIMSKFVKLYVRFIQSLNDCVNIGFIIDSRPYATVYTSFEKLVEYLVKWYEFIDKDAELFILHFKTIELVKLI